MAAPRNRKHIVVGLEPRAQAYTPHFRGLKSAQAPAPASRSAHGKALKQALQKAIAEAHRRRSESGLEVHGAVPGLYVEFESQPGIPLELTSLESPTRGIELVAVTEAHTPEEPPRRIERATVFVPEGKVKYFVKRFEEYAQDTPKQKGERRHESMLDPVLSLRLATLRALWTDASSAYPATEDRIWWEVWLRRHDGQELERLMEFAQHANLTVAEQRLEFDDRIVTLILASAVQLSASLDVLDDLAEVRLAKETAAPFQKMGSTEQFEWARELLDRVARTPGGCPAVCVLDTGVSRGHPLLAASLFEADCHACDPQWGSHDHHGHGTEMAGLALYGDLVPVLASSDRVRLRHGLESVKILPPKGRNKPRLYGTVTAEATSRVELQSPTRARCFSMAITATDKRDLGQPTSWSAAVDALAAGRTFDATSQGLVYLDDGEAPCSRLFVVSAGNVGGVDLQAQHLDRSDVEPVRDPAQAWNALTVGAFTEKSLIADPDWEGWLPLAPPGELSPWSVTGVPFRRPWPNKPDIVFEGGNVVVSPKGEIDFPCADLSLLTTHFRPTERAFSLSWATSAASAQVARIAALIASEYPELWPEAIRALVVHSAEWTSRMKEHLGAARTKRARVMLVRRYGFGVPSPERALRSASDALTLVAQNTIKPFRDGAMREMHLFALPWPRDTLLELGELPVRLRVTLSYFVEPNPGRRGWRTRYRYASHGVRFQVKRSTESVNEFHKRVNKRALEEDEEKSGASGHSSDWYLGEDARSHGSIHADMLEAMASDVAERGVIAVYPVSGWWKDQPKRDRSERGARYALIVSIETTGIEADIWTPVAQQVGVPVDIEAE